MSDALTLCWFGDSIDLLDPFPTCFVPWKLLVLWALSSFPSEQVDTSTPMGKMVFHGAWCRCGTRTRLNRRQFSMRPWPGTKYWPLTF
jgi:hypothetical protein